MAHPEPDEHGYRTLAQLSFEVRVVPEVIRRDLRLGRIKADQPGAEYLFNREQWGTAVEFYRDLARRRRNGTAPLGR